MNRRNALTAAGQKGPPPPPREVKPEVFNVGYFDGWTALAFGLGAVLLVCSWAWMVGRLWW